MNTRMSHKEAERLYMENQGLVGFFYRKYAGMLSFANIDQEDILQQIRMSIWEATLLYDADKAKFSSWAGRTVCHDLIHLRRKHLTKGRYAANCAVSLDNPVSAEVDVLLVDLLPSGDDVESRCIAAMDFETHRRKLKPKARKALELRLGGMTQYEIAAEIGCAQSQVSRYLKQAAAFAAD
jgi:RNA polymerase sigma factor (sigma-70 family)